MLSNPAVAVTQLDTLERDCPFTPAQLLERANLLEQRAEATSNSPDKWLLRRQAADLRSMFYKKRDVEILADALLKVVLAKGPLQPEASKALFEVGYHPKTGEQS